MQEMLKKIKASLTKRPRRRLGVGNTTTSAQAQDQQQALEAESVDTQQEALDAELQTPKTCHAMLINGKYLVFGGAWTPVSEETGWKKIRRTAFAEGYAHYALSEHETTVGLFGALPDLAQSAQHTHSVALVLSQHFSTGGTELYVFEHGDLCAMVGLMEYAPIPGYDAVGTQAEIQQLVQEFADINNAQVVHNYGNVNWLSDIQHLDLNKVAYKTDVKRTKLKPIPNLKLLAALGLVAVMCVAAALYGFQQYLDMRQADADAMAATSQNPNMIYEMALGFALPNTGQPGVRNLAVWREFFAALPLTVGGWNFKTLECKQLVCDVVWTRASGTFRSFESSLPTTLNATTRIKLENDLVKAEVQTTHKLSDLLAGSSKQGLDIKGLPYEYEVQNLWGSQLQDLSLLKNLTVNLGKSVLFGGQGQVADLIRPIVKGTWSLEHDIWSLPELPLPDYVVPENLKIARSDARDLRYKIEGSYYAKAK